MVLFVVFGRELRKEKEDSCSKYLKTELCIKNKDENASKFR